MSSPVPTPAPVPLPPDTASWPRRITALFIDWFASWFAAVTLLSAMGFNPSERGIINWVVLFVFWLETTIGVAWLGGSFGQLLCRLRVLTLDDRAQLGLAKAMLRALLVCLVIPPVITTTGGRGLHDLAVRSAVFVYRP